MTSTFLILGAGLSYLVGAIPFGLIIGRLKGVDILKEGSGNIGATNVGRLLGRGYGLTVFFLDLLKGGVPAWVGMHFLHEPLGPEMSGILLGACSFMGHIFPVYLGFKGGKGVATGAGVMAVLIPIPFSFAIATWLAVVSSSRMVSLGSLLSTQVLVVLQGGIALCANTSGAWLLLGFTILSAAFVWVKHLANIRRILQGTENKVQDSLMWHGMGNLIFMLALSVWLGSYFFFTFVLGPGVFQWFESAVLGDTRPYWLPVPEVFLQPSPEGMPNPLLKEQASRLAGLVVTPLFKIYYPLQIACAFFVLLLLCGRLVAGGSGNASKSAISWFCVGLFLVIANWLLLAPTENARLKRANSTDAYVLAGSENKPNLEKVIADRKEFGKIHGISLIINLGTGLALFAGVICTSIHNDRKPEMFNKK